MCGLDGRARRWRGGQGIHAALGGWPCRLAQCSWEGFSRCASERSSPGASATRRHPTCRMTACRPKVSRRCLRARGCATTWKRKCTSQSRSKSKSDPHQNGNENQSRNAITNENQNWNENRNPSKMQIKIEMELIIKTEM